MPGEAVAPNDNSEQITIVVNEPQAETTALFTDASESSIQEVVPMPVEKPAPRAPKVKRTLAKLQRSLASLQEPEQSLATHVRGLEQAPPLAAQPGRRAGVPPLIGGRGVAARADLGRASPLSGAAPDVFAAGHHVASAANCGAYADLPYFREDVFGRTLRLSCE